MNPLGEPTALRVEVRCPVPVIFNNGTEHAGRLFMVIYLSMEDAVADHSDSVIELPCSWCFHQAKKSGQQVRRVLHRFTLEGEFISSVTDPG